MTIRDELARLIREEMRHGSTSAETAAAILARYDLHPKGSVVVPEELTVDMAAAMECAFGTEEQWAAALAARPGASP